MDLFKKIATSIIGMAMAIGVGVGINSFSGAKESRATSATLFASELVINDDSQSSGYKKYKGSQTLGGFSFDITDIMPGTGDNDGKFQFKASSSVMYNTASFGSYVENVQIFGTSALKVKFGTSSSPSVDYDSSTSSAITTYTPKTSGNYDFIKIFKDTGSAAYPEKIVINFVSSGGGGGGGGSSHEAGDVTDTIDYNACNISGGSTSQSTSSGTWVDFSISGTSGATYQIHTLGVSGQTNYALRWNDNGYLYISKTADKNGKSYKLKSISATTIASKTVNIFAANSAYSAKATGAALKALNASTTEATYEFESNYKYLAINGTQSSTQIKSFVIEWDEVPNYTVTFAVNTEGYGTVSQSSLSVPSGSSISTSNNQVTINGTTVTATPEESTAQYTYAFSSWSNASGTVTEDRTITANFSRTTNTFTVGGTITNGALSSTASITYGNPLDITINPSDGFTYPDALTSVTMGGNTLVAGTGYTYTASSGRIQIASVTGDVVITATCKVDGVTYNISGTITNGSLTGQTGDQMEGGNYIVTIVPNKLYKYPTSITITGAGVEDTGWTYNSSNGEIGINNLSDDVTISATCDSASITSISVSGQKTEFTLGDSFSFGGTVNASYDDAAGTTDETISTDLVNIDSSAYNPFAEANTDKETKYYTISVSLKSNSEVNTSYNVTVTKKTIENITTYNKVSSSKSDWSGKYVIMSDGNGYVMGTTISSSRVANGTLADIKNTSGNTIGSEDTVIASGYSNYVYTISYVSTVSSVKYYTISPDAGTNSGKFLAGNGTNNQATFLANTDTSDSRLWSINYNNGFVIENKGNKASSKNATLRNNTTYGFAAYAGSTGNAPSLFEKVETPSGTRSLIRLTATGPADNAKIEGYVCEPSDFTATALFDTTATETVTPEIVSGATLSKGSNTVTLSYTEGTITKTCEVTVIAAEQTAQLDGIVWNKEGIAYTEFAGITIDFGTLQKHYDDEQTGALLLSECTVAVYNDNEGAVKAHDIANPETYTWSKENDDGKYLSVTFEEYTLYSGKLDIVERINEVVGKIPTWECKTVLTSLKVGDTVVMTGTKADGTDPYEYSGISGTIGSATDFTTNPVGLGILEVVEGSSTGSFAFKDSDGNYISFSTNKALAVDAEISDSTSWTITFDDANATIKNVEDTDAILQYNSSSPRFCTYESAQRPITFYRATAKYIPDPEGSDIANTNAVVQKAVLDFADHFNEVMECVNAGTTTNVSGKWESLSGDLDELLGSFDGQDLDHLKALLAGADAVEGGDTLQDMLARYEYICGKYKLEDFLADIDRPPVPKRGYTSPFGALNIDSNTSVVIITVISMLSITALGGFFFIRKRKEDK